MTVMDKSALILSNPPDISHPFPEVNVKELTDILVPHESMLFQLVKDTPSIHQKPEELQEYALPSGLGSHKDS